MSTAPRARRTRNIFDPKDGSAFSLSRSKIELFVNCPRCFYLDRRLGIGQPPGFPFNLNSAVDHLLKKEFDRYRGAAKPHPLMQAHGIEAIPYSDSRLEEWRANFKGVTYRHTATNFILSGAVDDLWVNPAGEVIVVDYKATSKEGEVGIEAEWQQSYKRQMEFYQWLLRRNGLTVSKTGYFVYCNGRRDCEIFDSKLEFTIKIIPYVGDDTWVEQRIQDAHRCLVANEIPPASPNCYYCSYRVAAREVE